MPELKVEPSDDKDGEKDSLLELIGIVSEAWGKRVNEAPRSAEKAEEISRRGDLSCIARCVVVVVCLYFAYDIFLNDDSATVASASRLQELSGWRVFR